MMPLLLLVNTFTLLGPTLLSAVVDSQVFLAKGWDNPYIAWGAGEDSQISLPYSMLATLLAAFIERPFIRAAGFRHNALLFSIRANIWSWLIGTMLAYAFLLIGPFHEGFFALHVLAVPFSIAVGRSANCLRIIRKQKRKRKRKRKRGQVQLGLWVWERRGFNRRLAPCRSARCLRTIRKRKPNRKRGQVQFRVLASALFCDGLVTLGTQRVQSAASALPLRRGLRPRRLESKWPSSAWR